MSKRAPRIQRAIRAPSYIEFVLLPAMPKRRTAIWEVRSKQHGDLLGQILWHCAWRCYAFNPRPACVFELTCLHDIAHFLEIETAKHRRARRSA